MPTKSRGPPRAGAHLEQGFTKSMGPPRAGAHQEQGPSKSRGPPRAGAQQEQGLTKSRVPPRAGAHQEQGPTKSRAHQEQGPTKSRAHQEQGPTKSRGSEEQGSTKSRGPPRAGAHQEQGPTKSRVPTKKHEPMQPLRGRGDVEGPKEARGLGTYQISENYRSEYLGFTCANRKGTFFNYSVHWQSIRIYCSLSKCVLPNIKLFTLNQGVLGQSLKEGRKCVI